ncbi:MAG: spermidine synthase [Chitinispirillaceae bacterium]
MNAPFSQQQHLIESSNWINNLVDGNSGLTLRVKQTLFCDASPFQKIEVFETYGFGRILALAGMIVLTERDEHIYNEMITHPVMLAGTPPRSVCIIGGGDGGALREVLKHDSVKKVTVVEIDRQVTETVKRFFPSMGGGFDDSRTELVFNDGYAWLEASNRTFDVIIIDSYDPAGPVQSLETGNFFELVKKALTPETGRAVLQASSPDLNRDKIRNTMKELCRFFLWNNPYLATIPSLPNGICSFLLCRQQKNREIQWSENADKIAEFCGYFAPQLLTGAFCLPRSSLEIFFG